MDRLEHLSTRLEVGTISDRELDELEAMLADNYEARERFLDHAQVEGLLFAASDRSDTSENVLPFENGEAASEKPGLSREKSPCS